ncbi:MAG TPA: hypothetical protein ENJ19_10445 [Gammaproteobacteria bacterium]|nr:hypothetical protein [Gammaproteobacteria bacterium]
MNGPYNKQSGAALIVSLMLLLAVTALGVTVMNVSLLELKIATNNRDAYDSLARAEAALRIAEDQVRAVLQPDTFSWGDPDHYYAHADTPVPDPLPADPLEIANWDAFTAAVTAGGDRFVIEYLGCRALPAGAGECGSPRPAEYVETYRISVAAQDASGAARIVQEHYRRRVQPLSDPNWPMAGSVPVPQVYESYAWSMR